ERLNVLLLKRLAGHELHVGLPASATDRGGVIAVVRLVLAKGLHILWRDAPNPMARCFKSTRPVKSAGAGFDRNRARRESLDFCHQPVTPNPPLQHGGAINTFAVKLENVLCEIDTNECY